MSKSARDKRKILTEIEEYLKKEIDTGKSSKDEHNEAADELQLLVYKLIQAKFKPDCDGWRGVESLVWSKRTHDAFHFRPVADRYSIGERLRSHSINLSCAQSSIERIANEVKYNEEVKK